MTVPRVDSLVANNKLSGSLPSELAQLSRLRLLMAHRNQLTGSLPNLSPTWLLTLTLHQNRMGGLLPSFADFHNLENLVSLPHPLLMRLADSSSLPPDALREQLPGPSRAPAVGLGI